MNVRRLLVEEEFVYSKNKLTQLAVAVGIILTVAGLLLLIQNAFAQNPPNVTASTLFTLRAICIENSGTWYDYYCGGLSQQNKLGFEKRVISEGLVDEYKYLSMPSSAFAFSNPNPYQTIIIKEDDDDDDDDDNDNDNDRDKKPWWWKKDRHNDNNKDDDDDKKDKDCKKDGKVWFEGKCMTEDDKVGREHAIEDENKKEEPIGFDKDGKQLPTINGDYDELEEKDEKQHKEESESWEEKSMKEKGYVDLKASPTFGPDEENPDYEPDEPKQEEEEEESNDNYDEPEEEEKEEQEEPEEEDEPEEEEEEESEDESEEE